jgi:hypothetical protein
MTTTQPTIDAKIPHNGSGLLTRVVYQYAPEEFDGMALLVLVGAKILQDGDAVPVNLTNWAQDWLDCDGYDRALQHAEHERGK